MITTRVSIRFIGRPKGALGVLSEVIRRRTIKVPNGFTVEEAKAAAQVALYEAEGDDVAWEHIAVKSVAFN